MNYSYVMGCNDNILQLKNIGFDIQKDNDNYMVVFNDNLQNDWENFVSNNLQEGYWNEYIANDKVVFLFKIDGEIKRYEVFNFKNKEVLKLCERLCNRKFWSIKKMLLGNHFYKKIIKN